MQAEHGPLRLGLDALSPFLFIISLRSSLATLSFFFLVYIIPHDIRYVPSLTTSFLLQHD